MAYRGVWSATGLVVGLFAAAALAGCTAEAPASTSATTSAPIAQDAASSFADQFPYLPTAGTTLATASLRGTGGCPRGPVSIVVTSALALEVRVPGTAATTGTIFRLSTARTGPDSGLPVSTLPDEQLGVGIGEEPRTDPDGEAVFPLPRESRADRGDLTYFHSIRCVGQDGDVLEQAPLTWTQGPFFRAIHPVDSGPRPHARGDVVVTAGVLTRYNVVPGDTLDAIADRFGIRPVELLYINPSMGYISPRLLSGDALNLDPRIR